MASAAVVNEVGAERCLDGGATDPDWYRLPIFYFSNPAGIFGPRAEIPIPPGCTEFDYELEVAAVVGGGGGNLSPKEAESRIAGYLVLCDFTARDIQAREMALRLGPAKGKDTATSFGPWLVTPDELNSRRSSHTFDLEMTASVNGQTYSHGRLDSMIWSFPELVSYASRGTRIVPACPRQRHPDTVRTRSLENISLEINLSSRS